ncbi:MAG: DUF885 domain-containing protein [Gammaproteobacteria bacterium]|nr:DUF885 domain-containing protein [Gammaproteobacteria bacterium]NNF49816.1 DUF885 domain-containing protein [Woeseiaceae bacterium]MBT8094571.1 DUF885 domain-containing protein [Gammaproteobacteria bacterium]MBT8105170.1 DUF885 domain-containing protein [Gammaproteobacteria bacterium]NNK25184.1 DUF885 domain-containing protein [Woeseiaceae bacterium]
MKSFALVPALALLAAGAHAMNPTDAAFETLADEYVADLASLSPVNATLVGDHSADGELDQVDAAAREEVLALLKQYAAALEALDFDALSRANQVDAALLLHELESNIWSIETLQEWAWNPLYYVRISGSGIYGLLARDFAPLEARLASAASRLEQLPRFLEQGRASLDPGRVPSVHAETAAQQNAGLNSIIDNMIVPHLDQLGATDRARVETAIETARDAIAEHQAWLEDELVPRARGDFRIGEALYDAKLAFALNSPLSRKEIAARAEREYEEVRNRMYEVAQTVYLGLYPMTAFPDDPDEAYRQAIIRAALEQAYRALPPPDGIVEVARQQLQEATDFVVEHNLVEMPGEPVEIIVMPEFQRGVSVAYLDPPGPLDRDQPAFYAVAPLPADWTADQVESFLREYNLYSLQDLTIHEGVPGHYLQLALSNRYPSTLRSLLWSGPFVEGWAVYAEQMMVEAGYQDNDPLQRLIALKWYLRAVTNAIIDAAIHVDGMTRDEAMKLMVEGGFQEEREAAGKWVRAQLTSAQLSTYFVGYQEHVGMRAAVEAAWGDEFTLRRYHDRALSYGSPPVKYVRALILDEPIPRDRAR